MATHRTDTDADVRGREVIELAAIGNEGTRRILTRSQAVTESAGDGKDEEDSCIDEDGEDRWNGNATYERVTDECAAIMSENQLCR
jgi:hypothetical protein